MSHVIVLSSSPAPTFAPSPTQVDLPSSPNVSREVREYSSNENSDTHKTVQRSWKAHSSISHPVKHILEPKLCAENVPVGSKSSSKYGSKPLQLGSVLSRSPVESKQFGTVAAERQGRQDAFVSTFSLDWDDSPQHTVVKVLPSDAKRRKRSDNLKSSYFDRAPVRKKDWTPTKPVCAKSDDQSQNTDSSSFGMDFAKTFGHYQAPTVFKKTVNTSDGALTKRQKIDTLGNNTEKSFRTLNHILKPDTKVESMRKKSPTKKGLLTITGLATSRFGAAEEEEEVTPMMKYLVSTQSKIASDELPDTFETKCKKKGSKVKIRQPKSRLKSPATAQKVADSQELIFGTASQLARQESPTLMRDTQEAIKQSEAIQFSSPLRSQHTGIFSVESTSPERVGASRYLGRRSLWSAAHRDEENALVHLDGGTEYCPKESASAGMDNLVNDVASTAQDESSDNSFALLAALRPSTGVCNVDSITSSPLLNAVNGGCISKPRSYSTTTRSPTSKRTKSNDGESSYRKDSDIDGSQNPMPRVDGNAKKPTPPKPNYATWTDEQIKDAVKAHGIKRLRARKSMIEKLDEIWALEHGLDPMVVKLATKKASQTVKVLQPADILGNVHDFAARPATKTKKPRVKRVDRSKNVTFVPKQDEDEVINISDIENSNLTAFDRLASLKAFADESESEESVDCIDVPPSTAPVRGTGVKAVARAKEDIQKLQNTKRPLTPPPTITTSTQSQSQISSPGFEEFQRLSPPSMHYPLSAEIPASPDLTSALNSFSTDEFSDPPLKSRIREAITHVPRDNDTRNHQTNPTWHEKILLYDPIVLEELTAWLNTEGFNAIGEDREIDIIEVRDWCHQEGVCCLWKGGWRGNKRTGKTEKKAPKE